MPERAERLTASEQPNERHKDISITHFPAPPMIPKHVQASDFADPVDCIGPVDCATCVFVALADELPQKDRSGES
jgi:hypothetical protein